MKDKLEMTTAVIHRHQEHNREVDQQQHQQQQQQQQHEIMTLNTFLQDLILIKGGGGEGEFGDDDSNENDLGSSKRSLPVVLDIVDDNPRLTREQVKTIRSCRSFSGYEMALRKHNLHSHAHINHDGDNDGDHHGGSKGNSRWETNPNMDSEHAKKTKNRFDMLLLSSSTSSDANDNDSNNSFTNSKRNGSFDSALNMPLRRESIEIKSLGALNLMWDKSGGSSHSKNNGGSCNKKNVPLIDEYDSDLEEDDDDEVVEDEDEDDSSDSDEQQQRQHAIPEPHGTILKSVDSATLMRNVVMHHDHETANVVETSKKANATFDFPASSFGGETLVVSKASSGSSSTYDRRQQKQQQPQQQGQQQQRTPSFLELCEQAARDHMNSDGSGSKKVPNKSSQYYAAEPVLPIRQEKQQQRSQNHQRTPSFLELCEQAARDHMNQSSSASGTTTTSQNYQYAEPIPTPVKQQVELEPLQQQPRQQQHQRTPSFLELCEQAARDHMTATTRETTTPNPSSQNSNHYLQQQAPYLSTQATSGKGGQRETPQQRTPSFLELCEQSARDHLSMNANATADASSYHSISGRGGQKEPQHQRTPSFLELCEQSARDHLLNATNYSSPNQAYGVTPASSFSPTGLAQGSNPTKSHQRTPSFLELCEQSARDHLLTNSVQDDAPKQQPHQRTPSFLELCEQSARDHMMINASSTHTNATSHSDDCITINLQNDYAESSINALQQREHPSTAGTANPVDHVTSASGKVSLTPAMLKALRQSGALSNKAGGASASGFMGAKNAPSSLQNAMLMASSSRNQHGGMVSSGATKSFPPPGHAGVMKKGIPSSTGNTCRLGDSLSALTYHGPTSAYRPDPSMIGGRDPSVQSNPMLPPRGDTNNSSLSQNDLVALFSNSMKKVGNNQNSTSSNFSSSPALQYAMMASSNSNAMLSPTSPTHNMANVGAGSMGNVFSSSPSLRNAMLSSNAATAMGSSNSNINNMFTSASNSALRNAMLTASAPSNTKDNRMTMLLMRERQLQAEHRRQQDPVATDDTGINSKDLEGGSISAPVEDISSSPAVPPGEKDTSGTATMAEDEVLSPMAGVLSPEPQRDSKMISDVRPSSFRKSRAYIEEIDEARSARKKDLSPSRSARKKDLSPSRPARKKDLSPSRWSSTPPDSTIPHSRSCESFMTMPNRVVSPISKEKPSVSSSTAPRQRGVRRAKSVSDAEAGPVRRPLRRRLKSQRSNPDLMQTSRTGSADTQPMKRRPLLGSVKVIGDPSLHRSFHRRDRKFETPEDDRRRTTEGEEQDSNCRWSRTDSCDSFLKRPNRQVSPSNKKEVIKAARDDIEEFKNRFLNNRLRASATNVEPSKSVVEPNLPELDLPELSLNDIFDKSDDESPYASGEKSLHRSVGHISYDAGDRWAPTASMKRSGSCESFLKRPDRKPSDSTLPPVKKRGGRKPQKTGISVREDSRWSAENASTDTSQGISARGDSCESFLKQPSRQDSLTKVDNEKNNSTFVKGNMVIVPLGCNINQLLAINSTKNEPTASKPLGSSRSSPSLGGGVKHYSSVSTDNKGTNSIRAALGKMAPTGVKKHPIASSSSIIPRRGAGGDLAQTKTNSRRRMRSLRSMGELDTIVETDGHGHQHGHYDRDQECQQQMNQPLNASQKSRSFGDFKLARQKSKRERTKVKVEMARKNSKEGVNDDILSRKLKSRSANSLLGIGIGSGGGGGGIGSGGGGGQNARW